MKTERYPDVVNFHFTDVCNYHCSYCFVDKKDNSTLCLREISRCLRNIKGYFEETNGGRGRINLVGGEPLTYPYLQEVIDMVCSCGMTCSLVTNGLLLTKDFIDRNNKKMSCIGISVDSLQESTNRIIGRCSSSGRTLTQSDMEQRCRWIREAGIDLKINICYSRLNHKEDFIPFLEVVKPNRIKLFQMLIVKGINEGSSRDVLSIDDFNDVVHQFDGTRIVAESNELMENSYLIVNSKGELIGKENGAERIIGSLLETSFKELVDQSGIVAARFFQRYAKN